MTDYSERNAFIEALYDRWYDYICQQCYRFVNYEPIRSLLVEDCVQEAFIKAARHYAQLQSHPNAVGWIIKTSENQILNETRKLRVRRKTLSLDSGSAAPLPTSPANEIENWLSKQNTADTIVAIRELLSDRESNVFDEFFVKEHSLKATAETLNLSSSAVASTIHRIRGKLKKFFYSE